MPVAKVTSTQFATQIASGISSRDATVDTAYGPVPDIVIVPLSKVLEQQNDRLRQVSLLIALQNSTIFADSDVDQFVFNEGLIRSQGAQTTGTVVFSTSTAPTSDVTVQRGFPIATAPDESTGQAITFVTTAATTLPSATASSYFNPATNRYELPVPVISLTTGTSAIVAANRVNRPLRPLVTFDSVTNPSAINQGGTAAETNAQLISRYQSSVAGRQLSTLAGLRKYVLDKFPGVIDLLAITAGNPLLVRASSDVGAVDAFVITNTTAQQVDTVTFTGVGQLLPATLPPIVTVISVTNLNHPATLILGTDYVASLDTSGYSGSTRGADGITILSTATNLPVVGDQLQITYTYNSLVRNLQSDSQQDDVNVIGRNLLFRQATQVNIVVTASIFSFPGFNPSTLGVQAQTAIVNWINGLLLGQPVQGSDLQQQVRAITGIDNFIITRLTTTATATGTADINITANSYARTSNANVIITAQ